MKQLIEALNIFLKYADPRCPTHCEHDVLTICGIDPAAVSKEDKEKLEKLGFFVDEGENEGCFYSFRYGSC